MKNGCRPADPPDEPRGATGDQIGQVVARAVPGEHRATVVGQLVAEAAVAATRPQPLVPAGIRAGAERLVAVQVLPHQRGSVAGALERDRDAALACAVPAKGPVAAFGSRIAQHVGVVRERAGQDRRPRAAAERVGDDELPERHPSTLHPAHLWHVPQQVPRQVVGEDIDDVGSRRRRQVQRASRPTRFPRSRRTRRSGFAKARARDISSMEARRRTSGRPHTRG